MKKHKKRNPVKTLQNKAAKLWKEYCFVRDGRICQVRKYYPEIEIEHDTVLQVDHMITRKNKFLFFEPANGTVVCRNCNNAKHWDNKSVGRAIDDIVKRREGTVKYEEMVCLDMAKSGNNDFHKVWWIEEQIDKLQKGIETLKAEMGVEK